jgi:hypothetical protein
VQLPHDVPVSSGTWTVAAGDVSGLHNTWGFDSIGWTPASIGYIRENASGNTPHVMLPCGYVSYQALSISCASSPTPEIYLDPVKLSQTVYAMKLASCRDVYTTSPAHSACVDISY